MYGYAQQPAKGLSHDILADVESDLRRLSTAYHEAGHAVIASLLEFPVRRVTIERDRDFLGVTEFAAGLTERVGDALRGDEPTPERLALAERYLLVVLAGPVAQKRHTGMENMVGASRDLDIVTDLLLGADRDPRQAMLHYDRLRHQAETLVAREWEPIERLAVALHEETSLDEDRLRDLLPRPAANA